MLENPLFEPPPPLRIGRRLAKVAPPWNRGASVDGSDRDVAMKVTLERTALLKALGHVHRIVERRNTIPILSNVLIEARERQLTLKATDLDLEATESAPADVAQEGSTTVPAHVLYEIVRKLPEGAQVSLEMSGEISQLLLRSGRARFHLQALPAS